jgi:hypothetical protein
VLFHFELTSTVDDNPAVESVLHIEQACETLWAQAESWALIHIYYT